MAYVVAAHWHTKDGADDRLAKEEAIPNLLAAREREFFETFG